MEANSLVGRRIAVVGTSGCGKSYVAQALAQKFGLIYISNDAIIWRPTWQPTPHAERVSAIEKATSSEGWTFDGNLHVRNVDDRIVLERCDTIVWLDLPRWQVWGHVILRTARRIVTQEELWNGNRESLQMAFSRDSVIWLAIKSFGRRRNRYAAMFDASYLAGRTLIRLRARREVNDWLATVSSGPRPYRHPPIA